MRGEWAGDGNAVLNKTSPRHRRGYDISMQFNARRSVRFSTRISGRRDAIRKGLPLAISVGREGVPWLVVLVVRIPAETNTLVFVK